MALSPTPDDPDPPAPVATRSAGDGDSSVRALLRAAETARGGSRLERGTVRPLGPKAARTRQALLDQAWHLFLVQGYKATSVEDIARAADVGVGTFYQYFRSRAGAMAALLGESILALFAATSRWDTARGTAGLQAVIDPFVRHYAATAAFQGVWEEVTHVDPELADLRRQLTRAFTAQLADEFLRAAKAGLVRTDLDSTVMASAVTAMVDRYCYITYVFDPPASGLPDPQQVSEMLSTLCASAVGLEERAGSSG